MIELGTPGEEIADPARPDTVKAELENEPLPSTTNQMHIADFTVGHYKEFKLREELAGLIEKYNKKFYKDSGKPKVGAEGGTKDGKYKTKAIMNPVAIPDPSAAESNYSWMYLITPYYNQLVKEFDTQMLENNILKQHFEYFIKMEGEKNELDHEYSDLKKLETQLLNQIKAAQTEANVLDSKT